jgi:hypothetical protein
LDRRRCGTRAIAAFIVIAGLPEKRAPLLFAKKGILAPDSSLSSEEKQYEPRPSALARLSGHEQPLATMGPAHGLVKKQGFDLRRSIRRAF